MSEANLEIVRAQHRAFNASGRFCVENAHPDVEWVAAREDPDAAVHRGVEAVQRYFDSWSGTIADLTLEANDVIDAEERVFAWIRVTGRGRASGAPVELEQAQVWIFRGAKVARVEEYFNRAEGLEAAGLHE